MTPTTFQTPELRDNLDNIIQAGAYGKKTAFCNAQNTGVLDYINNNLMYLWTNLIDESTIDSKIATAEANTDSKISAHNTDTNSHADIREALEHVSGVPLGTIIPFAGNGDFPNGFLLCNGASVARTMYPDLFNIIGTTYGAVDSEHFNLPDLRDKFIEGADVGGTVKEAGLPNITGSASVVAYPDNDYGGAITAGHYLVNNVFNAWTGEYNQGGAGPVPLVLNASRSSSVYGNSTTVQPPALTMRYIIKAFDGQTEDSALIDVTQYENELNNIKANYLPLSGGKVTGPISGAGNANTLLLMSEPDLVSGSYLALDGKDEPNTAGSFRLEAGKMVNGVRKAYMLIGRTDGSLIWNNNLVATTNKLSMPSESFIALSITTNGQLYTAPTDGWFFCNGTSTAAGQYINIDKAICYSGFAQGTTPVLYPMRKGQSVHIYYAIPSITDARFFYAQSAV